MNAQAVTHHGKITLQALLPNGQSPEQDCCIFLLTWPVVGWMHLDTWKTAVSSEGVVEHHWCTAETAK